MENRVAIKRKKKIFTKKSIAIYSLMLPGILYFLINNYLPMAGIVIAFKKINYRVGIFQSPWNGLDNFKFLFQSGSAWQITRNTVLYNIAFIILGILIPVTVAILINEVRRRRASKLYQTLVLLPYLMSMVVVSYLAYAFLSGETGYINNSILPMLGIDEKIKFYSESKYWPFILIFVNQWKSLGFGMVIYLSCVIGISQDFFEAAKIDGASKWQQIKNITLPLLKPTVITMFILNLGRMFYSDFGLFYQVPKNSGMIYDVTQTIDTFVYNALMSQNNIGMSSAAGFYQSIVGFTLVIAANLVIRKLSPDDAMF